MTGKRQPELRCSVDMPDCCRHIWHWFLQLNASRTSNGFGMNPITNADLWFFFQLEQIEPESWELELIRRFDSVALENYSKQQEKENNNK